MQIIRLRARAAAEVGEAKPYDIGRARDRGHGAAGDFNLRGEIHPAGQPLVCGAHLRVFAAVGRGFKIRGRPGKGAHAIVGVAFQRKNLQALVQQGDGGQKAVARQPVGIQFVGGVVGGRHKTDAAVQHSAQHSPQYHRVGNVGDMKLVEADEVVFARQAVGDLRQRVALPFAGLHVRVKAAHELVKVRPHFFFASRVQKKAVHQEAFSASHAAVQVESGGGGGGICVRAKFAGQSGENAAVLFGRRGQGVGEILQQFDGLGLDRVRSHLSGAQQV